MIMLIVVLAFLAVLFCVLWVLSERDADKRALALSRSVTRNTYLEPRSHAYGVLLSKLNESPVRCQKCGRFLRGKEGVAIVVNPVGPPFLVIHAHRKCVADLLPGNGIKVHFTGQANPDNPFLGHLCHVSASQFPST